MNMIYVFNLDIKVEFCRSLDFKYFQNDKLNMNTDVILDF